MLDDVLAPEAPIAGLVESYVEPIVDRLDRFNGLGVRILFRITDENISFTSSARAKAVVVHEVVLDARGIARMEAPGRSHDCVIKIGHDDLYRLYTEDLDPRFALFVMAMQVEGDPAMAIKFGDRLQNKQFANKNPDLTYVPKLTTDLAEARRDLKQAGYCLIKDVLSPSEVATLKARLDEQAAGETAAGVAFRDGGAKEPNQRVWNLINKGRVFLDLLSLPIVDQLARESLGDNYHLFSFTANITGPGSEPQVLHYDQTFAHPPIPIQLGLNFAIFLDDVTEVNGGTRLLPGSHMPNVAPNNPLSIAETIAAEGPAGSILVFDSRLWHGTGPNVTSELRRILLLFCVRYFIRPQETAILTLAPDVERGLTPAQKAVMGFRCSNGVGGGDRGPRDGLVERVVDPVVALTAAGACIPYESQPGLS